MLKYNNLFVAQNLSVNVIAFMGDCTLEGRPCILNIPWEKPWAWPEIKFLINPIEMQTHLSQEENRHAMWDTTGRTNLKTVKLPRLEVVPYAVLECLSKRGRKTNELRVLLEEMMRTYVNFKI